MVFLLMLYCYYYKPEREGYYYKPEREGFPSVFRYTKRGLLKSFEKMERKFACFLQKNEKKPSKKFY